MKLTTEELNKINDNAFEMKQKHPQLRAGQSIFNAANDYIQKNRPELYPAFTEKLRGTDLDCFYKDERINAFTFALAELEC